MKNFDYYVALITATATEEAGVMHMYKDWKPLNLEGDSQKYYETVVERRGKRLKLVTARQDEMGMTAAGVLTMKMITLFKPRFVFMVGIAAGVAHRNSVEQIYGDIVIPDVVWDYSSGKFVSAKRARVSYGEVGFIPRPRFVNTDESLIALVERAIESPDNEFHVHIGSMACGSTVFLCATPAAIPTIKTNLGLNRVIIFIVSTPAAVIPISSCRAATSFRRFPFRSTAVS